MLKKLKKKYPEENGEKLEEKYNQKIHWSIVILKLFFLVCPTH